MALTLTDVVAVGGLVSGVAGLAIGVMNFVRDRARLDISLQWDFKATPGSGYDPNTYLGVVRVSNVGRRTTYISHVAVKLPNCYEESHLLAMDSVTGEKLAEGDPPRIYVVPQKDMAKYARDWNRLVAQVSDSTGKVWTSKPVRKKPTWAGGQAPESIA